MQVNCFLQVSTSNLLLCSYVVEGRGNDVAREVIAGFPYEGVFFFRVKVSGRAIGVSGSEYVWLDIGSSDKCDKQFDLSRWAGHQGRLEVRVTPREVFFCPDSHALLFCEDEDGREKLFQEAAEAHFNAHSSISNSNNNSNNITSSNSNTKSSSNSNANNNNNNTSNSNTGGLDASGALKSLGKVLKSMGTAEGEGLRAVQKGASSLWQAMRSTVTSLNSNLAQSLALEPSTASSSSSRGVSRGREVDEALSFLHGKLSRPFSQEEDGEDVAALRRIFLRGLVDSRLSSGQAFQRISEEYRLLGFQQSDPVKDLKGGNALSLFCADYLLSRYAAPSAACIVRNKDNVKANYPFAIVCVNLTLLLAEVFALRDCLGSSTAISYEMFRSPEVFFEVFSICFFHIDYVWTKNKLTRADFATVINGLKATLQTIVRQGSIRSLDDFIQKAEGEGMFIIPEQPGE